MYSPTDRTSDAVSSRLLSSRWTIPIALVLLIFGLRLAGIMVTNYTELNPFSHGQATNYPRFAAATAEGLRAGEGYEIELFGRSSRRLGPILAPMWLLPGPSWLYTQLLNASVATLAIYNVFVIGKRSHSTLAGLIAVTPLAVFPSYVLMHSTLQREAMVLFGVTTAVRVLVVPPPRWSSTMRHAVAGGALFIPIFMRWDNAAVIGVAGLICMVGYLYHRRNISIPAVLGGAAVVYLIYWYQGYRGDLTEYLPELRERRARGRVEYLPEYVPQSTFELAMFSWIAAIYFLFVPFPWMVETIADFAIMLESFVTIGFALFAVKGVTVVYWRHPVATVGLVAAIVVGSVGYGLGTANVGPAVRHRQGMVWILFLLGGIGAASTFLDPATTELESRTKRAGNKISRELSRYPKLPEKRRPDTRRRD